MVKLIVCCLNMWGSHRVHASMEKMGIKNFKSHTQNIITGKELLLCNKNEGKQTKVKISHVKSMDNLHLLVHPVIANVELIF